LGRNRLKMELFDLYIPTLCSISIALLLELTILKTHFAREKLKVHLQLGNQGCGDPHLPMKII